LSLNVQAKEERAYERIVNLEKLIVKNKEDNAIVTKLKSQRKEAINFLLSQVSPEHVDNEKFISLLIDGQEEAQMTDLGVKRFYMMLENIKKRNQVSNTVARRLEQVSQFISAFHHSKIEYGKLNLYASEKEETEKEKEETEKEKEETEKEKEETEKEKEETEKEKEETEETKKELERAKELNELVKSIMHP